MSKKSTSESNQRAEQRIRHKELIKACIRQENGRISFVDVRDLYARSFPDARSQADLRTHFRQDCESLVESFQHFSDSYASPFFLPLPKIEFDGKAKQLSIPFGRRPIAIAKNKVPEHFQTRRKLAQFLLDLNWSTVSQGSKAMMVFPRKGRIYAGFGSTVCFVFAEAVYERNDDLSALTVYTGSKEISSMLYFRHQSAGAEEAGILLGDQLQVDRKEGALMYSKETVTGAIDTAIISCHSVYRGTAYSTARKDIHEIALPLLKKADRIVIVAESWKIGRTGGYPMDIPGIGTKPVLLVTDADQRSVDEHFPLIDNVFHSIMP